jgi:hypothetical protein
LLRQHAVERLGLRHRARKAVEDEAVLRVRLLDALGRRCHHDVVGTSAPRAMMSLACRPTGVPAFTAARSMSPVESCTMPYLRRALGLRALARPRRAQQNQLIGLGVPFSFDLLIRPSYWCASRCDWICVTVSMVTLTTIRSDVPPK